MSLRARVTNAIKQHALIREGRQQHEGRHVAFILPIAEFGGGGNVVLQEAKALAKMGVTVSLINYKQSMKHLNLEIFSPLNLIGVESEAEITELLAANSWQFDGVITTLYKTVFCLPRKLNGYLRFGYYIQDFEPQFFAKGSPDYYLAMNSYTERDDVVPITKTAWN